MPLHFRSTFSACAAWNRRRRVAFIVGQWEFLKLYSFPSLLSIYIIISIHNPDPWTLNGIRYCLFRDTALWSGWFIPLRQIKLVSQTFGWVLGSISDPQIQAVIPHIEPCLILIEAGVNRQMRHQHFFKSLLSSCTSLPSTFSSFARLVSLLKTRSNLCPCLLYFLQICVEQ